MSCHVIQERAAKNPRILTLRSHPLRLALVGQPNVGKSVVFGRLTGRYVTVSNYPGTTVAITKGRSVAEEPFCTYRPDLDRYMPTHEEVGHDSQIH